MNPSIAKPFAGRHKSKKGQTMVEYAMILAAIAVTASVAFNLTGRYTDQSIDRTSRLLVAHHGDGN